MACNSCETSFESNRSIIVTVLMSGGSAIVYVKNHGRNIVMIRRILLCYNQGAGSGSGMLFLRPPPDQISWGPQNAFLEPGMSGSYFTFTASNLTLVQAQAEYIEIEGRSLSCSTP